MKQKMQPKSKEMKKQWNNKAEELQRAADHKNTQHFLDELKAVYGPKMQWNVTILLCRWKYAHHRSWRFLETMGGTLQQTTEQTVVSQSAIDEISQFPTQEDLSLPPSLAETTKAIRQISNGEAPGADCIPIQV